jgi:hypothetical protein
VDLRGLARCVWRGRHPGEIRWRGLWVQGLEAPGNERAPYGRERVGIEGKAGIVSARWLLAKAWVEQKATKETKRMNVAQERWRRLAEAAGQVKPSY